jgi:Family of unknown function (DUF5681)
MAIRPISRPSPAELVPSLPRIRARSRPAPSSEPSHTSSPDQDYEVGYGKPPLQTRFQPGRSGNPNGRPKSAKGLNAIARSTLTEKVKVRTANGDKKMTRIEAVLHKLMELAMKGNGGALANLLKIYAGAVPDEKQHGEMPASSDDFTAADNAILAELRLLLEAPEGGAL